MQETLALAAARDPEVDDGPAVDVASWVGLDAVRHSWVQSLSVARRQRLSIGIELTARPGLLVILGDRAEHDIGRDRDLVARLRTISRDMGCTVLFPTSDLTDLDLADTVLVLDQSGRLSYSGPPVSGEVALAGRLGRGQAAVPARLPPWAPDLEREAPLMHLRTVLHAEALMITRRGNGAMALVLLPLPALGVVALSTTEPVPYLAVAALTGTAVGRFDLFSEWRRLIRGAERGVSLGTAVLGKMMVYGLAAVALSAPMAGVAALRGPAVAVVPGLPGWVSLAVFFWLAILTMLGVGMLASATARTVRSVVAVTAILATVFVVLGSMAARWNWIAWSMGFAVLAAAAARAAVAVLEKRAAPAAS